MGSLAAHPQPDLHLPPQLKRRSLPLLRQSRQLEQRQLEKMEDLQLLQVLGNLCPQQLPAVPKLALQISHRIRILFTGRAGMLPLLLVKDWSLPAHPMNKMFQGPGLFPKNLALSQAQRSQIVQRAQMKKRNHKLKWCLKAREAPHIQHLQRYRRSSCPNHRHLRSAANFLIQLHRLGVQHQRLHPEKRNPDPSLQ